jgi:hypothetical protein
VALIRRREGGGTYQLPPIGFDARRPYREGSRTAHRDARLVSKDLTQDLKDVGIDPRRARELLGQLDHGYILRVAKEAFDVFEEQPPVVDRTGDLDA